MATNQKTAFLYEAPSTTQSVRRSMSDGVKGVWPSDCPLLFAVDVGIDANEGDNVKKPTKGRIGKSVSKSSAGNLRVESSVWVGADQYKEVTSASGLTLGFSNVLDMTVKQKWYNPNTDTQGIIDSVNASPTNTCVFITCGSTTFSASIGDKLIPCATAYEDNYSSINYYQHAEDVIYNVMNTYGLGFEMGDLRKSADFYISNYYESMRKFNWGHQLRGVENDFIWGKRPASNNVTAMTTSGVSVHHSAGLMDYAQSSIEVGGAIDKHFLFRTLPDQLPKCIGGDKPMLGLVSQKAWSQIAEVQYDKWMYMAEAGEQGVFGNYANLIVNSRCPIFWMPHPAFAYGLAETKGLLLIPENIEYKYHVNADFQIKDSVQPKEQGGQKDIIVGTCCLIPKCGGYTLVKLTDISVG